MSVSGAVSGRLNSVRPEDRTVHDWYRFVLSFPPHLVQDYLDRFGIGSEKTVLDPFAGTATTLVECKKRGIASVGIEPNPMAQFASSVKLDWSVDPAALSDYAAEVSDDARRNLARDGYSDWGELPLFAAPAGARVPLRTLAAEQDKLLLKDSISPLPLHKTLVVLDAIAAYGDDQQRRFGRLALANALVRTIGNLKFGPEVGIGKIKHDAPVIDAWLDCLGAMIDDLALVRDGADVSARVFLGDSRRADEILPPGSVDGVITSPPYPNEKDYTRTTRLESVILGLIGDKDSLRKLKKDLIRSNTRGVYKSDADDLEVSEHNAIQEIARNIEQRRVELGKTSGFERQYARVTKLYFGGMVKHLAGLRRVLKRGAKLAYVVGDQASYLRVMIRTGSLLADLAQSLGYRVIDIELFRTRMSTATGDQLREEVVILEWPRARPPEPAGRAAAAGRVAGSGGAA